MFLWLLSLSLFRLLSSLLRSWRPVATVSFPSPPPLKMNGGPSGFCRDLWSILKKSSQFVGFFPFYFGFFFGEKFNFFGCLSWQIMLRSRGPSSSRVLCWRSPSASVVVLFVSDWIIRFFSFVIDSPDDCSWF